MHLMKMPSGEYFASHRRESAYGVVKRLGSLCFERAYDGKKECLGATEQATMELHIIVIGNKTQSFTALYVTKLLSRSRSSPRRNVSSPEILS